jgi:lactoylglutathione lyase
MRNRASSIGWVVDDRDALAGAGVGVLPSPFLDFQDPWGNRIEAESYDSIQFAKAANVQRGVGLAHIEKSAKATRAAGSKRG